MKVLFLSFYFEPDLCAGSFRNTSLLESLNSKIKSSDTIDVITTHPNRYDSYQVKSIDFEQRGENITINRVSVPNHKSGILGQIKLFKIFYFEALKIAKKEKYDLVYASSSRLFTAFLGARLASKNKAKLYLDIRDIFRETITDLFKTNRFVFLFLNLIISFVEKYTFSKANAVNLVSPGFEDYFRENNYAVNADFYFNTNGIDDLFLNNNQNEVLTVKNKKTRIVYAGNIGSSQALDQTLPFVANQLTDAYEFHIYGDGGRKDLLISKIKDNNSKNIFFHKPVARHELVKIYNNSDILFFQLSNEDAFLRVIPSKLFEYSTFNKPILAVVDGYCKMFIKTNLEGCFVAKPNDIKDIVENILKINKNKLYNRKSFITEFSRKKINNKLTLSILKYLK